MNSKKEMNILYKKILNNYYSFPEDLIEKIMLILNKESIQWELLKTNIIKKLKKNLFHNLLYFRKEPHYIFNKNNNNDYFYYIISQNNILKTIVCKKNDIKLKWNNPIVCLWSENDIINDWDWFNNIWNNI